MEKHSSSRKSNPPLFYLLVFIVAACTFYFVHVLYKMHQSKSWITTEATMIDSKLKIASRKGVNTFRAKASYSYEIDGMNYQNNRVTFFDLGTDNVGSSSLISQKLSTASKVLIYVNPKNPEESTIITGMTNSFMFPVWILSILAFLTYCYYRKLHGVSIGLKKIAMILFFFWCCGMVLFFTNTFTIDMEKKISILEEREIIEDKPPLKLVEEDIQRGVDTNQFLDFKGPKDISDIRVMNIQSLFDDKKSPYLVYLQFTYYTNEVKETFKGSIVYKRKDSNWVADFQ